VIFPIGEQCSFLHAEGLTAAKTLNSDDIKITLCIHMEHINAHTVLAEHLEGNSSLEDTSLNLTTIIKWMRWHSIPLAED
jgi:hypothetical protein